MINLIPNEEKKKKVLDFYFRWTVVFFMVLGFSMIIACVSILPAYFLSVTKKNVFNTKLEAQKSEPIPLDDQKTLQAVSDLKNRLNIIEASVPNQFLVSEKVVNQIMANKMLDIKISKIFYTKATDESKKITITGSAPSRDRLLLFRKALEDDPSFKKVDLPVSNFIKGSDINFSVNLIPV